MREPTGAERREHLRAPIRIVVRVVSDGDHMRYSSKDISAGGVFLLSEDPLAEESLVKLELFLPKISAPVRADGEVVWTKRLNPAGFAVRFTEISDGARDLIRFVVSRHLDGSRD